LFISASEELPFASDQHVHQTTSVRVYRDERDALSTSASPHASTSASSPKAHPIMRWAWRLLFVVLWGFILIRLAPHVGAVLGIETRDDVSPEYTFTTLDGTVITHDSLRGQVVLVNVWATWCAPCRVKMPALQAMANRHRAAGLTVLVLSRDHADASVVEAFLQRDSYQSNSCRCCALRASAVNAVAVAHGEPH